MFKPLDLSFWGPPFVTTAGRFDTLEMGETAKAEVARTLAGKLLVRNGDLVRQAQIHLSLARLRRTQGNPKDAHEQYRNAVRSENDGRRHIRYR